MKKMILTSKKTKTTNFYNLSDKTFGLVSLNRYKKTIPNIDFIIFDILIIFQCTAFFLHSFIILSS